MKDEAKVAERPALVPVENNTSAPVILPPTHSYPQGLVLRPTEMRHVEQAYLDELCNRKIKSYDSDGNQLPDRYPGKLEWDRLTTQRVRITTVRDNQIREDFGTILTVYKLDQAPRGEGVALPVSLTTYNAVAARAIINSCNDKERLALWAKDRHKDSSVPELARTRLASLGRG